MADHEELAKQLTHEAEFLAHTEYDAISELLRQAAAALLEDRWKPIDGPIKRKVLVTNNLYGRDGLGQMSHVWRVSLVFEKDGNGYTAFDDSTRLIECLTHYCELPTLPKPVSEKPSTTSGKEK